VPKGHEVSVVNGQRAGWLRAMVLEAVEGQPAYSASPKVRAADAETIGATATVLHATTINNEIIGLSEGVPGQHFQLQHSPVVPGDPVVLEVASGEGWQEWRHVTSFAEAGPDDRVYTLDATNGVLQLGPGVRLADGTFRQFGSVPPKGVPMRVRQYRTGGGSQGNVAARAINLMRTTIPFVASAENRAAASGGVDGETIDNAKVRGPVQVRMRNRAITAGDYEVLAREAAPEIARVRAVPASADDPSGVRVLVVPSAAGELHGRLRFEQLVPESDALQRIAAYLDERRIIGARVVVEPPRYQGITVVARVKARPRFEALKLRDDCLSSLYGYFHPVTGGHDGDGWPFGRPLHVGEVYSVLQRLPGVEIIEDARLFAADPITGERGQAVQRLEIDPNALVFSYEHQVMVEGS
jgi:predicted phage baseplate assembly protein